jgi:cold shock protein
LSTIRIAVAVGSRHRAQGENAMTGTIKKIIRPKGFGFITPDDGTEDVFFHRGSLAPRNQFEDFNEGDTVQFQTRKGEKGPVAFDLKIR